MRIFVIGGKARSGKNTFGDLLKNELENYGYKPCIMHITEPLYTYARIYFHWDGNEEDKPRDFLQKMGIEIRTLICATGNGVPIIPYFDVRHLAAADQVA